MMKSLGLPLLPVIKKTYLNNSEQLETVAGCQTDLSSYIANPPAHKAFWRLVEYRKDVAFPETQFVGRFRVVVKHSPCQERLKGFRHDFTA